MSENRARFAQNFLRDPSLAISLLKRSSLSKSDLVLEIGPGEGIFTRPLSKIARQVIAVEIDPHYVCKLKGSFLPDNSNVKVHLSDFTKFSLPSHPFKLFSNVPFNATANILKKILASSQMLEACLILQKEAAEKYAGHDREFEVSVLAKPFYTFHFVHRFQCEDFDPVPSVDVVMILIRRRTIPMVQQIEDQLYKCFVKHGFRSTKPNLRLAYKKVFTFTQWKKLSLDLRFQREATASMLNYEQWIKLFRFFATMVTPEKRNLITCNRM